MNKMRVVPEWQTYLPHILIIGLMWAVAMTLDYHEEAERAQDSAQQMSAQMAACLRGEWRGITSSGEQIACLPAETYHPERGS